MHGGDNVMHIALVDPSHAVQAAVASLLESAGHVISSFTDSRVALETVRADETIEVVMAAGELTPIGNVELCWELRLIAGDSRPMYIALMSSSLDERTAIEALDVGADDLIRQPPSKEEFHAKLRAAERLLTLQRKLVRLATTDPLTGLLNRRAFFERGGAACANAQIDGTVSVILLDIDHFKEVNDLYGHFTGDETLRAVAREVGRGQKVAGRLGGDELCTLLDACGEAEALEAAEELRGRIENLSVKTANGRTSVTCSLGVAELVPHDDIDGLIRSADLALYRAKLEGRARTATTPTKDWLEENPLKKGRVARAAPRKSTVQA